MMSVLETKRRRAQLGGRKSHLVNQIAIMYFNTNTNAKKNLFKRCISCTLTDSSSEEEQENDSRKPLMSKVNNIVTKLKEAENQAKQFQENTAKLRKADNTCNPNKLKTFLQEQKNKNTKKFIIKAKTFNETIAGEIVIINISCLLYQVDKSDEKKIRPRSYLTPENYELTRKYYSGIQETSQRILDVADKLGSLVESGKLEGDLQDWHKFVKKMEEDRRKRNQFSCSKCVKNLYTNVKKTIIDFINETCVCFDEESMLLLS